MMAPMTLEGRVALVTGAAGGIGGAVTAAFAGAGASVLAVDRAPAAPAERVVPHACDVTRAGDVEAAVAAAVERFGRLDVLFNGVGISGRRLGDGPVDECTDEAWEAVLDTNLRSVFLCCKHAVPALRQSGGGAIVNLASVLALVGGDEDFATHAYAASKGGIVALTRAMAVTYAPEGIRCNVVCPSLIATPMSRRAQDDPRIRARLADLQPLTGELVQPDVVSVAWI
jgi:NAD(P)-dependent dehydrogenase (short-subunit alcohol dehydrogenase family)